MDENQLVTRLLNGKPALTLTEIRHLVLGSRILDDYALSYKAANQRPSPKSNFRPGQPLLEQLLGFLGNTGLSPLAPIPLAIISLSKSPSDPFYIGKRPRTEHPIVLPHPSCSDACGGAQISVRSMK